MPTTTTTISRLKLDFPDLGYDGGAGLHSEYTTFLTKIGDMTNSRFFTEDALANAASVDFDHNFKTAFDQLVANLYERNTGTGELTRIVSGGTPDLDDFVIAATPGFLTTNIRVTNNTGSAQDIALVVVHGAVTVIDASLVNSGVVNTGTQSFAGEKHFDDNTGFGTTSPSQPIHAYSTAGGNEFLAKLESTIGAPALELISGSNATHVLSNTAGDFFLVQGGSTASLGTTTFDVTSAGVGTLLGTLNAPAINFGGADNLDFYEEQQTASTTWIKNSGTGTVDSANTFTLKAVRVGNQVTVTVELSSLTITGTIASLKTDNSLNTNFRPSTRAFMSGVPRTGNSQHLEAQIESSGSIILSVYTEALAGSTFTTGETKPGTITVVYSL